MDGSVISEHEGCTERIAELEQHVCELERSLENARKERDAAEAQVQEWGKRWSAEESRAVRAEQERDAALADNAALVKKMRAAGEALHCGGFVDLTVGGDHPGAALLEAHRKALESEKQRFSNAMARIAEEAEHFLRRPVAADLMSVLDSIERVAVRARNEGLEKVAKRMESLGHGPLITTAALLAKNVRSMKEPEGGQS